MTKKDFSQIAQLVKARFSSGELDGRKLSKSVKTWALGMGLIVLKNGKYCFPEYNNDTYIPRYSTPLESILLFMEEDNCFQNGSIGASISKRTFWNYLDIYYKGQSSFSEHDRLEQEEILIRMHQAGLIDFQSAGSIWDIRKAAR